MVRKVLTGKPYILGASWDSSGLVTGSRDSSLADPFREICPFVYEYALARYWITIRSAL